MNILNLYCGIGGNRKLWGDEHEITAVELNPEIAAIYQDFFPNDTVIVTDAHQYLLDHYKEFDFIWSSPPCQSHSKMARVNHKRYDIRKYPDMALYQEIIYLQEFFPGKYVVENVTPYYKPLLEGQKVGRHLVWANFKVPNIEIKKIKGFIDANYTDLQKWLGIELKEKVYLNENHDPCQILRNCVHPNFGLHVLNTALNIQEPIQEGLFE